MTLASAERRLDLFLEIARHLRKKGRKGRADRHAAIYFAWEARQELRREDS